MKQIEGTETANWFAVFSCDNEVRSSTLWLSDLKSLLSEELLWGSPSLSVEHEVMPIKALSPSIETSMQLMLPETAGRKAVAMGMPLMVKVLSFCMDLFQVNRTPSDERQIASASTTSRFLINRPLMECRRTPED